MRSPRESEDFVDNMVYTITAILAFIGIFIMIFVDYKIGFVIGISAVFVILMGMIWNS
jgi:hypothetical protein